MLFDRAFAIPHALSLLVACFFFAAAVRRPGTARKLYAWLFVYAFVVNSVVCLLAPASYVDNARFALLEPYHAFIVGWFSRHVTPFVGAIALGQAAVAAGLFAGGRLARPALAGAIAFFVAIAPLGVGSAFPSSLIWAAGAAWLLVARRADRAPAAGQGGDAVRVHRPGGGQGADIVKAKESVRAAGHGYSPRAFAPPVSSQAKHPSIAIRSGKMR